MKTYRITKFNPAKRNPKGYYSDDSEWTSISDIGNEKYGSPSWEEYEKTEAAYVNAILLILDELGMCSLTVKSLEHYNSEEDFLNFERDGRLRNIDFDFGKDLSVLRNDRELTLDKIAKLTKLILRETIWFLMVSDRIEIKFGYDYYMYATCERISAETIERIQESGLFVEPGVDQAKVIYGNQNGT